VRGNGRLEAPEACDDGNVINEDGSVALELASEHRPDSARVELVPRDDESVTGANRKNR